MYDIIEVTQPHHVADIEMLSRRVHDEREPTVPYDEDWVFKQASLVAIDTKRDHQNGWIMYHQGVPIGYLHAYADYHYTHRSLVAWQNLWYVVPEYRGSRAAVMLMDVFEQWAHDIGAIETKTTVLLDNQDDVGRISKLFERLGYKEVGRFHVKEISNGRQVTSTRTATVG